MLTKRYIILSTIAVAVVALAILSTAVWIRQDRAGHADGTATRQAAGAPTADSHKPVAADPPTVPFRPGMGPSGHQDAKPPKRMTIAELSAHAEQDMARVAARQAQSRPAAGHTGAAPAGPGAAGSTASATDQGATPDGAAAPAVRQPQVLDGNPFRIKPPPHRPHVQPGPNPNDNTPSTTGAG